MSLLIAIAALVILIIAGIAYSKPERPHTIDLSHPVYMQAQRRANMLQRAQAITYNKLLNSYSIKAAAHAWPSDEDQIVGIAQPQPNKRTLKLVYSK